jgi:hypothetical protein
MFSDILLALKTPTIKVPDLIFFEYYKISDLLVISIKKMELRH